MKRLSKSKLTLVYAGEDLPNRIEKSIFLAGPTPRLDETKSWRDDAIQLLKDNKYDGVVFIPEARDGKKYPNYDDQIHWETKMLDLCDCILFWIPRELNENFEMLALTTNIEWGKYQRSEKVVIGFPKDSKENRYIEKECNDLSISIHSTLDNTVKSAIDFIGNGSLRIDGECYIPLNVWNTQMFQNWYKAQKAVGNELRYARVNYIFKMPIMKQIFLWILHVNVYIKEEDRIKDNEFVIARTDISSIVIYRKDEEDLLNSDVILIKEFRSPCCNSEGFVYEICGGSSYKDNDNINEVIKDEIKEETGLEFDADRIQYEGSRQLMATLCSHKCHLFSVKINENELNEIRKMEDSVHGVIEDTERTYLKVYKVKDLIGSDIIDWSNMGYIMSVLNKK